ncbi:MAG: CotH kinase family protein [Verrucomicrobiota bacterium]|nr:CotH kinase family protein [Verrucomicrobiota bacterium]
MPDFSPETRPANSPTVRWPSVINFSANTLSIGVQSLLQLVATLGTALTTVPAVEPGADEFYQHDKVQTIHLTISQENLKKMHNALPERIYVSGTFSWRDAKLENVGIRYKGNSSSRPEQRHKRSFLIKVNEFEKGVRFLGLRRISLDNGVQFGSLFSEPIITDILRAEGIPASRNNYARVFLNDKYIGVYGNVERIDESFVESRFKGKKGPLYKVHMPGPGATLSYAGEDVNEYKKAFEPKTNAADKNYAELIDLFRNIERSRKTKDTLPLEQRLQLDEFLKTTAIMLLAGCFDQLTGWNPHNYYLYQHQDASKWSYIPWDLDVGFADRAFGHLPVLDGWNAAWPIPGGPAKPILEAIVTQPELLKRYRIIADAILETHFKPGKLHRQLDSLHALIREDLAKDPFPKRRITNQDDKGYEDILNQFKQFATKRYHLARSQLDQPGERPKPHPGYQPENHRDPAPGNAPNGPSELRVVPYHDTVKIQWRDNAEKEAGHIIQRASRETNWRFRNHIPRPGRAETQAIDNRVVPGQTYQYRVYAVFQSPRSMTGSKPSNVIEITTKARVEQ